VVGDDKADTRVKLTRMPFDLRPHSPRLFSGSASDS
jgi:hypothetical protein